MESPRYWEYFKAIEADLESTSRYVDFNESNYCTYSNEFARILMAAGSEIDSVMKQLCGIVAPREKPSTINRYHPVVTEGTKGYAGFCKMMLGIPRFGLQIDPWKSWTAKHGPFWWGRGFTKVRHNRHGFFHAATLKNCIWAV